MRNFFLSLCAVFVLASCGAMKSTTSPKVGKAQASIDNTNWTLVDQVKGQVPTLKIEDSKISGNSGCNRYFGTVVTETSTGKFTLSQIGSNRMACDNMSVEKNFLDMLQKVNKYVVSGTTLELYQDNLLLLKFSKSE